MKPARRPPTSAAPHSSLQLAPKAGGDHETVAARFVLSGAETASARSEAGKHKSPGEPRLGNFGKNGAGEAIRTLDPNLGKVVLYP